MFHLSAGASWLIQADKPNRPCLIRPGSFLQEGPGFFIGWLIRYELPQNTHPDGCGATPDFAGTRGCHKPIGRPNNTRNHERKENVL